MDAKSLLRAKKASAKVDHPYATYTASGQLKCTVCAIPVHQWDAHLLTKQHRTSVAREKTQQAKSVGQTKRPATSDVGVAESSSKKVKVASSILPAGFFSAGNPAPISVDDDDDDEDGDVEKEETTGPVAGPSRILPSSKSAPASSTPSSINPPGPVSIAPTGDPELDDFLSSISADVTESTSAPPPPPPVPAVITNPKRTGYKTSSSAAIPVQASYEAAPVRNVPKEQKVEPEVEPEETEQQRRERIAREEREEIMGRLEEEERAQEDADSRVAALKTRMEMLKKKREAAGKDGVKSKSAKTKQENGDTVKNGSNGTHG